MTRREQWQPVLDAELKKWIAKSSEELVSELPVVRPSKVEFEGIKYAVEVQLLENTDKYVHVSIDVDDGSIPESFHPLSSSFIREK